MDRDVRVRLIAAPIVLAIVLGVLALHHHLQNPLPTDLLLVVVAMGAATEVARLLAPGASRTALWVSALGAGLLAAVGLFAPSEAQSVLRMELRVGFLAFLVLAHLGYPMRDLAPRASDDAARAALTWLVAGLLLSLGREIAVGPQGALRLAYVVVVAKASDMGAWAVGRAIGRHKLMPTVSPGKTWEGLFGGVAASVLAALWLPGVLGLSPEQDASPAALVGLGAALALASVIAGLIHSALKRRAGAKDSGRLVPVMGGVLDLVDSLLLAAPVAWLWLRLW